MHAAIFTQHSMNRFVFVVAVWSAEKKLNSTLSLTTFTIAWWMKRARKQNCIAVVCAVCTLVWSVRLRFDRDGDKYRRDRLFQLKKFAILMKWLLCICQDAAHNNIDSDLAMCIFVAIDCYRMSYRCVCSITSSFNQIIYQHWFIPEHGFLFDFNDDKI